MSYPNADERQAIILQSLFGGAVDIDAAEEDIAAAQLERDAWRDIEARLGSEA